MMTRRMALMKVAGLAVLLANAGCLGPLDTLGNETIVTQETDYLKENQLSDDKIEDKNPVFQAGLEVTEEFLGRQVVLNKSGSVTRLDVVPFEGDQEDLADRLFANRGEALAALGTADVIPSMEVVNGKLKPFNDGLYAAVETGLQEGIEGILQSKRVFLYDLLGALASLAESASGPQLEAVDQARAWVAAGLLAGGNPVDLPYELSSRAESYAAEFMSSSQARVLGFYEWNDLLSEVWRQDRYLQNLGSSGGTFEAFAAVAVALEQDSELSDRYQQILALYAGLTNPYSAYTPVDLFPYLEGLASLDSLDGIQAQFLAENPDLMTCAGARLALFPASRSKDTEFYNANWCQTGLPDGVSFIDVFISAIRSGDVDLGPDPDSGWYDYQLWALETLLLPERGPENDHLLLTAAYKKKLIDTFKSIITQNRETHVKQLAGGAMGSAMETVEIDLYPQFPVEPFPTFYLRTARGYRFLATYLQGVLGTEFMQAAARLHEDGSTSEETLGKELDGIIELMYGLYLASARSVGLDPQAYLLEDELAEIDLTACAARADRWLSEWSRDEDIRKDPRVIVPVSADDGTGKAVYWAILGIKAIRVSAEFVEGYEPKVVSCEYCEVKEMVPHYYVLLVEHMEEVRVGGGFLSRSEFREICNRHDNPDDILAELEARQ